jgi:hypothetical protein
MCLIWLCCWKLWKRLPSEEELGHEHQGTRMQ